MKTLKIMIGFLMVTLLASCQTLSTPKLPPKLNKPCPIFVFKKGKAMPQTIDLAVTYGHCRTNNNALIELLEPT